MSSVAFGVMTCAFGDEGVPIPEIRFYATGPGSPAVIVTLNDAPHGQTYYARFYADQNNWNPYYIIITNNAGNGGGGQTGYFGPRPNNLAGVNLEPFQVETSLTGASYGPLMTMFEIADLRTQAEKDAAPKFSNFREGVLPVIDKTGTLCWKYVAYGSVTDPSPSGTAGISIVSTFGASGGGNYFVQPTAVSGQWNFVRDYCDTTHDNAALRHQMIYRRSTGDNVNTAWSSSQIELGRRQTSSQTGNRTRSQFHIRNAKSNSGGIRG